MRIAVTQKHLKMLENLDDGRYLATIQRFETKMNKAKTGENLICHFAISEGDMAGRELPQYCSLKDDFGVAKLGEIARAAGAELGEDSNTIDTDDLVGENVVLEIENKLVDGKKMTNIQAVLPASTPLSAPY